MRKEGDYILGTPAEIAANVSEEVRKGIYKLIVPEFDFFVIDEEIPSLSLKRQFAAESVDNYIFGLKDIKTGFDNKYGNDLFCDYYGGGCGSYKCLHGLEDKTELEKIIKELICNTLVNYGYLRTRVNEVLLIIEYQKEKLHEIQHCKYLRQ